MPGLNKLISIEGRGKFRLLERSISTTTDIDTMTEKHVYHFRVAFSPGISVGHRVVYMGRRYTITAVDDTDQSNGLTLTTALQKA
ncbi:head-tail adaptor protein [Devosia sp. 2618]|uniref:phage head completion protein n=1 Tax=Devosia sp. 2618 TaxID=3156454 RepID=UPI00339987E7